MVPDGARGVALRSRSELLGMVPYLLGFHPQDSVVALFLGADRRLIATARIDVDAPVAVIVESLQRRGVQVAAGSMALIGYGPRAAAARVAAVADGVAAQVPVGQALLVSGGRFFCLGCRCDAAAGVLFDSATTAAAASATVAGVVAFASRAAFLALVDPDPGEQTAVAAAIADLPREHDAGTAVLRFMMDRAADGERLSVGQVARLAVLLRSVELRDAALSATSGSMWQRDLWFDVARRVPDPYLPASACLAAWCAWMRGEEPLALAALDRALATDPAYRLAHLLMQAVRAHIPARALVQREAPPQAMGGAAEHL